MRHREIKIEPPSELPASVFDYRLVLRASSSVWEEILLLKASFARTFKAENEVRTRPYITLVSFLSPAMAQDRLLRELRSILCGRSPFLVTLEDFGSLPTHTIYLQVKSAEAVKALSVSLRKCKPLMKVPGHDPHFVDSPLLVIARKLLPWQFEQGWLDFSNRHFKASFVANDMLLLCRSKGEKPSAYRELARLPMEARSVPAPLQTSLFDPA